MTHLFGIAIFCLASDARPLASRIGFGLSTEEAVKATEKEEAMQDSAVERVATAYSNARDEEARGPYSWLENYVERSEGEVAREECLDSYEYNAVMVTLLA